MHLFPSSIQADDYVYAREAACVDAAEAIAEALARSGMSRADLARALSVSPGEITVRLRGSRNLTVATLAETLHALGAQLEVKPAFPAERSASARSSSDEVSLRLGAWVFPESEHLDASHEEKHSSGAVFEAWPQ